MIKLDFLPIGDLSSIDEASIHEFIKDDPSILGLGDVFVRDHERRQSAAGRLDLLLEDDEGTRRYEVEIQLGATDPDHIIRTIEYWDLERRRHPRYDHIAVIVAEEITSRFFNVIQLFNRHIPLIAIQMKAVKIPNQPNDQNEIGIIFTKVLDISKFDFDENEMSYKPFNIDNWTEDNRASKETISMVNELIKLCHPFAPTAEPRYRKDYIGITVNGKACNFTTFKPKSHQTIIEIKLPRSEETEAEFEQQGIIPLTYNKYYKYYPIKIAHEDLEKHRDFLYKMLKQSYHYRQNR